MKYLLLIYSNEATWDAKSPAELSAVFAEYGRLTADLRASGKYLGGEPLEATSTASTVRVRDGKTLVTDGPFAETREQLGGFYLVEAENLDDALAMAARIPSALEGSIEVRPVMPMPG
jgi:hypothetical protein